MKKSLLIVLTALLSLNAIADDVLITKNSQKINAKIEEVGLDFIKYRRSDNPTGPLYTIAKKEIVSVIYDNGTVEVFQTEQQPIQIHNFDSKMAYEQYKKGTKLVNAGWGLFAGGTLMMIGIGVPTYCSTIRPISSYLSGEGFYFDYNLWAAGVATLTIGGGLIVASIPMICVGYSKRKRNANYNLNDNPDISYNITTGKDGLGFAINF